MERLLSLSKFFKYAFTILIYLIKRLNIHDINRNIYSDLCLIISEKVLLKSILCINEKLYVVSLVLYCKMLLSELYFTLNTYFNPIIFFFEDR